MSKVKTHWIVMSEDHESLIRGEEILGHVYTINYSRRKLYIGANATEWLTMVAAKESWEAKVSA